MAIAERDVEDVPIDTLIEEIAAAVGVEPTELPPLAGVVDPDSLAALIDDSGPDSVLVTFEYYGHEVTVDGTGDVKVRPSH